MLHQPRLHTATTLIDGYVWRMSPAQDHITPSDAAIGLKRIGHANAGRASLASTTSEHDAAK